jgi:hypothetical protein
LKAVRYRTGPDEYRIGRLDGDQIVDAGPAGEQGFVPTRAAWVELAAAAGAPRGRAPGPRPPTHLPGAYKKQKRAPE